MKLDASTQITLAVTLEDFKTIRDGLQELPFKVSAALISRLDQQVMAQTQAAAQEENGGSGGGK